MVIKNKLVFCFDCNSYKEIIAQYFGKGKAEYKLECGHFVDMKDAKVKFEDGRY